MSWLQTDVLSFPLLHLGFILEDNDYYTFTKPPVISGQHQYLLSLLLSFLT